MASVQPIIERLIFLNKKYELIEKQVRKENLDEKIQEKDIGLEPKLDSYRVFHGRGQLFPGLEFICVDYFQPVLLLTCFSEPPDLWLEDFLLQAKPLFSSMITAVLLQNRYEQKSPIRAIWGELPTGVLARRGQLTFCLQLGEQQNNGFFLDMEPGRQWIEQAAPGKRILNLFAYTCAFSVVAIAAGAQKVVNLDMSSRALEMGRDNHRQNHLDKRCSEFLAENILKSWGRIKRRGPYDIVIIDPPSYQPGSFVAQKDYGRIARRLPELLPEGGEVLACLNAPELGVDFLVNLFAVECPTAVFVRRLTPSPDFPDVNPEQQLKLLVFCLPACERSAQ